MVRIGFRTGAIASLLLCAAPAAMAQDAAAPAPAAAPSTAPGPDMIAAPVGDRVVVRGRRMSEVQGELEDFVSDFVEEVAAPPYGAGIARWQEGVCVGVYNLATEPAQYIADRVSLLALEVGLEAGEPGCDPQVMVMFTLDGAKLASEMVAEEPRMFRPFGGVVGTQPGLQAMDVFTASDAAVRWWHVSMPTDPRTGQPAITLPNADSPPVLTNGGGGGSRIYQQLRDDLMYVLIIVDATKVTDVTWEEIGDYVAMVSLAQIDPNANTTAFDSILNLFNNPEAYSGLTDWDRSYVTALYEFDQQRTSGMQAVELINTMARMEEGAN